MGKFTRKVKKNLKSIASFETQTARFHRQPKNGGTVIDMVEWDNNTLKAFFMENRKEHSGSSNGQYLAAFAHSLWSSAQRNEPQTKGEWVVYHIGKGFTGPCFRLGGYSGDFIPDEVEFDFYVLKDWGLSLSDLFEASDICAKIREKEKSGDIQVHRINS